MSSRTFYIGLAILALGVLGFWYTAHVEARREAEDRRRIHAKFCADVEALGYTFRGCPGWQEIKHLYGE